MEYPLNCYAGIRAEGTKGNELLELAKLGEWKKVEATIGNNSSLVNKTRNVRKPDHKSLKYLGEYWFFHYHQSSFHTLCAGAKSILKNGIQTSELPGALISYVEGRVCSPHCGQFYTMLQQPVLQTVWYCRGFLQFGAFPSLKTWQVNYCLDTVLKFNDSPNFAGGDCL